MVLVARWTLATAVACIALWTSAAEDTAEDGSLLAERGIAVTGGAAPGYVDDEVCGRCHQDLYRSYQDVGMARSFYPPSEAEPIEDFDAEPFFHPPSQRYYEMRRGDGGGIRFRRYQLDGQGEKINLFEQDVDWVLGSGHRSRTYLYRTAAGELYQLPVAWYTQESAWAMAPGYDSPEHLGVSRRVQRECMFCHNAYPDVTAGSDAYHQPQLFPAELPHGIGCQRCHGPGAEHARLGLADQVDFKALAAAIVDPGELDRERRREVCYQCHMQPSVALMGVRRFERGVYSYRPGEPLADYLVQIDVEEEGVERGERFEINHHPYRLEQSACFQKSGGELSCLTCHDPHRKVPVAERPAHYRRACLGCHQLDDCDLEEMAAASAAGPVELPRGVALDDCAGCHMSPRRAQDVVHAVMTDHLIRRRPGGQQLLAALEETTPVIVDARIKDPEGPQGNLGQLYRAIAAIRAGGSREAGEWLQKQLADAKPKELQPYLDLGRWQLDRQRTEAAAASFRSFLELRPDDGYVTGLLAITQAGLARGDESLALAARAVELDPRRPESHYNLGRLLLGYRGPEAAIPHLRRALELRFNLSAGWLQLGSALERLGRREEAADALRRALEIEPSFVRAYQALGPLLLELGKDDEARRYLEHARSLASAAASRDPDADIED
jgi:Flp pilus assembly protein TadD